MSDPKFVHLRVHSDYSMVDGLSKVPPLVKKVAELNMPAMALTDFTNLCGLVKFYSTAHGCGIKPIIGADFTVQSPDFADELTKITVLAKNNIGYNNLTLLISEAYQRGHVQHQPQCGAPLQHYGWAGDGASVRYGRRKLATRNRHCR